MATTKARYDRFARGSGCFTCDLCKRRTRRTSNDDNADMGLCYECYMICSWENTVSDNDPESEQVKYAKAEIARLKELCRSKGGQL